MQKIFICKCFLSFSALGLCLSPAFALSPKSSTPEIAYDLPFSETPQIQHARSKNRVFNFGIEIQRNILEAFRSGQGETQIRSTLEETVRNALSRSFQAPEIPGDRELPFVPDTGDEFLLAQLVNGLFYLHAHLADKSTTHWQMLDNLENRRFFFVVNPAEETYVSPNSAYCSSIHVVKPNADQEKYDYYLDLDMIKCMGVFPELRHNFSGLLNFYEGMIKHGGKGLKANHENHFGDWFNMNAKVIGWKKYARGRNQNQEAKWFSALQGLHEMLHHPAGDFGFFENNAFVQKVKRGLTEWKDVGAYGNFESPLLDELWGNLFSLIQTTSIDRGRNDKPFLPYEDTLLAMKRALFYASVGNPLLEKRVHQIINHGYSALAKYLHFCQQFHGGREGRETVFVTAETELFSMSGGVSAYNHDLPEVFAAEGSPTRVVSLLYRGSGRMGKMMEEAMRKHGAEKVHPRWGEPLSFTMGGKQYRVDLWRCKVKGVVYDLIDVPELFTVNEGPYEGNERDQALRWIGFAHACMEVFTSPSESFFPSMMYLSDDRMTPLRLLLTLEPERINHRTPLRGLPERIVQGVHNPANRWKISMNYLHLFGLQGEALRNLLDVSSDGAGNLDMTKAMFQIVTGSTMAFSEGNAQEIREGKWGKDLQAGSGRMVTIPHGIPATFLEEGWREVKTLKIDSDLLLRGINPDSRWKPHPEFQHLLPSIRGESKQISLGEIHRALQQHIQNSHSLEAKIREEFPTILDRDVDFFLQLSVSGDANAHYLAHVWAKLLTQFMLGLQVDPDIPLMTMFHRVSSQKGFQLLESIAHDLFSRRSGNKNPPQMIMSGIVDKKESELGRKLHSMAGEYSSQVRFHPDFFPKPLKLLFIMASDIFQSPSENEPFGLVPREAAACGNIVVANPVSGLLDLPPLKMEGGKYLGGNTIFLREFTSKAHLQAIREALELYEKQKENRKAMRFFGVENVRTWRDALQVYRGHGFLQLEDVPDPGISVAFPAEQRHLRTAA